MQLASARLLCLVMTLITCATATKPPNVVLFLADDLGYGDIGTFGSPTITTPHIDALARSGMTLRQFYSANSVCSPSRAGLLTGMQPVRNGIYSNFPRITRVFFPFGSGGLPKDVPTIPAMLRRANYSSHLVGKWHLGTKDALPTQRGFDSFFGIPYSNDMYSAYYGVENVPGMNRIVPPMPLLSDLNVVQQPADMSTLPQRMADSATDFIKAHAEDETPFFLMVAFYQPHTPLQPSARYANTSLRGLFGDVVSELDGIVGQVTDALESNNLTEQTLVHFSSDNGPWKKRGLIGGSSAGFEGGKAQTYEGGMRVPAIFSMPGTIPAGTTSLEVASGLDLYKTFADFAGVSLPAGEAQDSVSIACTLRGTCPDSRTRTIFYYYDRQLMAVRHGAYKLHIYTRCAYCESPPLLQVPPLLYQIEHDPFEEYALNTTDYATIVAELRALYDEQVDTTVIPPSEMDKYDLLAAPCCDPKPLVKPCYCEGPSSADDASPATDPTEAAYVAEQAHKALPTLPSYMQLVFENVLAQADETEPPQSAIKVEW